MEANDIFVDSYTDVLYFTFHKAESFCYYLVQKYKTTIVVNSIYFIITASNLNSYSKSNTE